MEYIKGGDLFDYIANRPPGLAEHIAREITRQILSAVSYLHSNNIVHRDIKPENVLVVSENPLHVQLTDFGFANFVDPESESPHEDMKSVVGTGCYMSPEVIDARGHGKPVDLFAVGVVMYKMLTGKLPFEGETLKECYATLMSRAPSFSAQPWGILSPHAEFLCRSMLDVEPNRRPTADQALGNKWFLEGKPVQIDVQLPPDVVDASSVSRVNRIGQNSVSRLEPIERKEGSAQLVNILSAPMMLTSPGVMSYDNGGRENQPISSQWI